MRDKKLSTKIEKQWFFSVVEETLLNEDFNKKYPDYAGGRIEIWHKDSPYDVEEIRLLLPREIFNKLREALDFQEVDMFQIGEVHSDDLLEFIKKQKHKKSQ